MGVKRLETSVEQQFALFGWHRFECGKNLSAVNPTVLADTSTRITPIVYAVRLDSIGLSSNSRITNTM